MDQSTKLSYNENITPSAPPTYPQHGVQPIHTQPGYVNSGYQPDFHQQPGFVPQPQQPITTHPIIVPHQPNNNDCGRLGRNRRQTGSVAGGLLLMVISGLHIGWAIWRVPILGIWYLTLSAGLQIFIIMTWAIGAALGGFLGSALTLKLQKRVIYYITAVAMIVGNLLFIIWDDNEIAIIVSRILLGIAHSVTYVTLITHAGENAANNMRATILSTINFMLYIGVFTSVIITGTVPFDWFGFPDTISGERIIGILGVLFAVASIACTITVSVETIPFLLQRNSRDRAMVNLKHLRDVYHETAEITQEMEEFNLMIVQDKQTNCNPFTNGNAKPLVLMIMLRLMVALTNNYSLNFFMLTFTAQMFHFNQLRLISLALVAPRPLMAVVQIFYADYFRRKTQFIVSFVLAGLLVILLGILANTIYSISQLYAIAALSLVFQFVCSIGMDQMQDVYLSEAFSTAKKAFSISIVTTIEHVFHIFMMGMFYAGYTSDAHINALIFVSGVVIILFGLILAFVLPETRRMSLRQARDAFIGYSVKITSPFA